MRALAGVVVIATACTFVKPDRTSNCLGAPFPDNFTTGSSCGMGTPTGTPPIRSGGALTFALPAGSASSSFCNYGAFGFASDGAFVWVSEVEASATGYTQLEVDFANHMILLSQNNDVRTLSFGDIGSGAPTTQFAVPYDPTTMQWWWIQATGPSTLAAFVSGDGRTWTALVDPIHGPATLDITPDTVPATTTLDFGAGHYGSDAAPSEAVFKSFDACP